MLPHIFDLFAQVQTPAQSDGGLGIGLSLVKDLVTLHGGSVQANSDGLGKGSSFTVRLPMEEGWGSAPVQPPKVRSCSANHASACSRWRGWKSGQKSSTTKMSA